MSFAPVAPIHILEKLKESGDLGRYHLVLAHDVLAHQFSFHSLFADYMFATIIVDNSVIELGYPLDPQAIRAAGEVFIGGQRSVYIVLPDALLDCDETIKLVKESLNDWAPYHDRFKFMFVPQGRTLREFIKCAEAFVDNPLIDCIGVARNIAHITGSRRDAIQLLHALFPTQGFHLLGFADNIWDDIQCLQMPTPFQSKIWGIDSAVPLRLENHEMALSDTFYPPRPKLWWESAKFTPTVLNNVRRYRRWIGANV